MIAQSEEKKDNKKNTKQDWNTLISQLKTESSKNIVKLNQMPIGRVSGKTENEKHRHLQSEPSIHFNVELILK